MCSLFGFLDYQGIIPHKILRKLTQALANAAEERGTDAAGMDTHLLHEALRDVKYMCGESLYESCYGGAW